MVMIQKDLRHRYYVMSVGCVCMCVHKTVGSIGRYLKGLDRYQIQTRMHALHNTVLTHRVS